MNKKKFTILIIEYDEADEPELQRQLSSLERSMMDKATFFKGLSRC